MAGLVPPFTLRLDSGIPEKIGIWIQRKLLNASILAKPKGELSGGNDRKRTDRSAKGVRDVQVAGDEGEKRE